MSLRCWMMMMMLVMVSACVILITVPVRAVDNQLTCPLNLTNLTGVMVSKTVTWLLNLSVMFTLVSYKHQFSQFGVQFFHIPESCISSNHSSCDVNHTHSYHGTTSNELQLPSRANRGQRFWLGSCRLQQLRNYGDLCAQ